MKRASSFTIGAIALLTAVLSHAGALYFLHNMQMNYATLSTRPLWENQHAFQNGDDFVPPDRQEVERRNQEIADLFKQVQVQKPAEVLTFTQDPKLDEGAQEKLHPLELEMGNGGVLLKNQEELLSNALKVDLIAKDPHALSDISQQGETPSSRALDVYFPSQKDVSEDLIKATEKALGMIPPNPDENIAIQELVKTGFEEGSPLSHGFVNQSGFTFEGRRDPFLSSAGALLFAGKEGEARSNSLQTLQKIVQKGNGIEGVPGALLGRPGKAHVASSDDFVLNVEYAARKEGEGYLFRLELKPKEGSHFRRIAQNYFFLIDRSASIPSARFDATKKAVAKALAYLHQGDTFNILLFDDKITPFAQSNVPYSQTSLEQAEQFLEKAKSGGLFTSTDLYQSLGRIVPEMVAPQEVNTAILLSDGDTNLNPDKQRETIVNWTRNNGGKISLYSMASGKGNNLALLDLLSVFNKGGLSYAVQTSGTEHILLQLIGAIRSPIAKQISVTTVGKPGAEITLLPPNSFLPNLFENTPYIVYGAINRLEDFHVFYQGRYYDKHLDIKQTVSFKEAHKGDQAVLEKKWALYQAYKRYEQYLTDGNKSHLAQAKQLLKAHRLPVAFE